jgi:hypothetical protein
MVAFFFKSSKLNPTTALATLLVLRTLFLAVVSASPFLLRRRHA